MIPSEDNNIFEEFDNIDEPTADDLSAIEDEMSFLSIDNDDSLTRNANTPFTHINEIQAYRMLSNEEFTELVKQRDLLTPNMSKYHSIINQMVEANLRFVVSWAYKLPHTSDSINDHIQVGYIGLIKAAKKFDLSKKCQFSTYASFWIKSEILQYHSLNQGMHISADVTIQHRKINKFISNFIKENYREPDYLEISKGTGISVERICSIENAFNIDSTDRPLLSGEDKGSTLGMFIAAEDNVEEKVLTKIGYEKLFRSMKNDLSPREYRIIYLRFGLDGLGRRTLDEVGKKIGVTRERIRQIEFDALEKLRVDPELKKEFAPHTTNKHRHNRSIRTT